MSFGYAVGDVIAVIGLLERIAQEVQNYRDAPRHFQQLGAELALLHSTIQCVLQVEATQAHEVEILERIRALAMHCRPEDVRRVVLSEIVAINTLLGVRQVLVQYLD
jgi:hypothetical protein